MTLPCKKQIVTLVDEGPTEDTQVTFYLYLGEIPDLEQYVVSRVVYRSREALFIDKQTGVLWSLIIGYLIMMKKNLSFLVMMGICICLLYADTSRKILISAPMFE